MSLLDRVAGAPITWGVDGSPGWGYLMPPDRVLAEMVELGLRATELGPDGWLGETTDQVLARLDRFGLGLVGGFVPAVLYRQDRVDQELTAFAEAVRTLRAGGAEIAVVGPDSHLPGYDTEVHLTDDEWDIFFEAFAQLQEIAAQHDITVATHPHWGMAVQDSRDVNQLLTRTSSRLCLDTGHLALAGVDQMALITAAADRIHHVHLKDVDPDLAAAVRSGERNFRAAVIDGLFTALGEGDVDLRGLIQALESRGFNGWYVLEQDVALAEEPPPAAGPIIDARTSLDYLHSLDADLTAPV
ncbi:TIM barrel protein [Euzebya tangerina]|uniref:TIM barrel protein n=1 Tax=Euzebya tangerina TaxID=591198 RepID=UPI000E30E6DC|nr:TIM barrel protein [Euzebya tangerina]